MSSVLTFTSQPPFTPQSLILHCRNLSLHHRIPLYNTAPIYITLPPFTSHPSYIRATHLQYSACFTSQPPFCIQVPIFTLHSPSTSPCLLYLNVLCPPSHHSTPTLHQRPPHQPPLPCTPVPFTTPLPGTPVHFAAPLPCTLVPFRALYFQLSPLLSPPPSLVILLQSFRSYLTQWVEGAACPDGGRDMLFMLAGR